MIIFKKKYQGEGAYKFYTKRYYVILIQYYAVFRYSITLTKLILPDFALCFENGNSGPWDMKNESKYSKGIFCVTVFLCCL